MQYQTFKIRARVLFVTLLLFVVWFKSGVAKEFKLSDELGPKEFDNKVIEHFLNSGEKGILTAFKGKPEMRGTDLQLSYFLKENETFKGEYLIVNATDNPLDLMILCLVDYYQREFRLNDQLANLHFTKIKPSERTLALVELPPLAKGAHDFILLAVNKGSTEEVDYQILFHRANIFVGDLTFPTVRYRQLGAQPAIAHRTYTPLLNLHSDYNYFEPLLTDKVGADQMRKYFLHINNPEALPIKSALVSFLNGKQIPINHGTKQDVLNWSIAAKRQDKIPLMLKAPSCQTGCELLVLSIDNPFVEMEPERGVMAQLPTRVRAANRLTIYSGGTIP